MTGPPGQGLAGKQASAANSSQRPIRKRSAPKKTGGEGIKGLELGLAQSRETSGKQLPDHRGGDDEDVDEEDDGAGEGDEDYGGTQSDDGGDDEEDDEEGSVTTESIQQLLFGASKFAKSMQSTYNFK